MKKLALLLVLLSGCTLWDDRASKACKTNADCFVAQGEHCDVMTKQCVTVDAGN